MGHPALDLNLMTNDEKSSTKFSALEFLALTAACEMNPEKKIAQEQLADSNVTRREFTGCGLFTHFKTNSASLLTDVDGRILRGSQQVSLSHPELAHGADIIVWVENGKMDCLEIVTFGVEDLPTSGDFTIQYWPANNG